MLTNNWIVLFFWTVSPCTDVCIFKRVCGDKYLSIFGIPRLSCNLSQTGNAYICEIVTLFKAKRKESYISANANAHNIYEANWCGTLTKPNQYAKNAIKNAGMLLLMVVGDGASCWTFCFVPYTQLCVAMCVATMRDTSNSLCSSILSKLSK